MPQRTRARHRVSRPSGSYVPVAPGCLQLTRAGPSIRKDSTRGSRGPSPSARWGAFQMSTGEPSGQMLPRPTGGVPPSVQGSRGGHAGFPAVLHGTRALPRPRSRGTHGHRNPFQRGRGGSCEWGWNENSFALCIMFFKQI